MITDEHGYPVIPHAVTGVDCDGCLMVVVRGGEADLTCNMCDTVVRSVPIEQATAALIEMASGEICTAYCTHCGALNTFPGFSVMYAFVCSECGEGVAIQRRVQ